MLLLQLLTEVSGPSGTNSSRLQGRLEIGGRYLGLDF